MIAATPCPGCGCTSPAGSSVHAVLAALVEDDLDRAIESGLLTAVACAGCGVDCAMTLAAARDARLQALAARERYRVRNARLQRRAAERAAQRAMPAPTATTATQATDIAAPRPALPSAAAAALARAKAKAAERRKP